MSHVRCELQRESFWRGSRSYVRLGRLAETIRTMAEHCNPTLQDDPQFLKNGGTIISLEEQQAVAAIARALQDLRIHWSAAN
ncbi:MAG: hypothetical protein C7B45_14125 [Sulfobacillus acidophilus]|uniref:Uncharacterized protein n=1 Tax=Sulfobacillus acidophilus TaxID=53633 RepID=A0A2T2WEK0_9FIRM|nr:MAG: hypothetical protein C7B45_14125 [Sulfobacillus acidophilus]